MRVLVSGGAGFIGSRVSNELVRRGHDVTVLDCLSPQIHGQVPECSDTFRSLDPLVTFVRGDVRSDSSWEAVLPDQDVVVHLAAETGTGQSMYEIDRYVDVNVRGTAKLLEQIGSGRYRVRAVVVASSRAIYGEGKYTSSNGVVFPGARKSSDLERGVFECVCEETGELLTAVATDEGSKISPTSIYGITKFNQEQMILTMGEPLGYRPVALRYQNVYGPGQSLRNPYTGILSIFSNLMRANLPVDIFEDGLESRDFVHIDDVVSATLASIEGDASGAINVGSGVPTTVLQVARLLQEGYQSQSNISISGRYRVGDIRHNYADRELAGSALNFEPRVSFDEGIATFVEWVKKQPLHDSGYERSLAEMRSKGLLK